MSKFKKIVFGDPSTKLEGIKFNEQMKLAARTAANLGALVGVGVFMIGAYYNKLVQGASISDVYPALLLGIFCLANCMGLAYVCLAQLVDPDELPVSRKKTTRRKSTRTPKGK